MRSLSYEERAVLFSHLARLEDAGVPAASALRTLGRDGGTALAARARCAAAGVGAGRDIARAGFRCGLFTTFERELLLALLKGGSPAGAYRRLAAHYRAKRARRRTVRSRLFVPGTMLVLALFVAPLPALVAGEMSATGYWLATVGSLVELAAFLYVLIRLPAWLRETGRWPVLGTAVDGLLVHLPVFGPMNVRRAVCDFLETLAWLLAAGVPLLEASAEALRAVDNRVVRAGLSEIEVRARAGKPLAEAVRGNPYIGRSRALPFISTGEGSGTLPEMLLRHAAAETEAIASFDEMVAEWLPRLAYAAVAAWVAGGLLAGGPSLLP
jgi:general secretion pathway protein F